MPKAFDMRQLVLDHDPLQRITEELPLTPDFLSPPISGAMALGQQIIDALVQGFHGWPTSRTGFTPADLLRLTADVGLGLGDLQTLAMRVTKLEGELMDLLENFSTYVQSIALDAAKWIQTYTGIGGGTLGITNGYAAFTPAANTVNKVATAISKVPAATDIQKVVTVISKPITDAAASANTILARVNPIVGGDHVFAKLTDTKAQIGFVKNGTTTVLGTVNNALKNGSTYTLEAGIKDAAGTVLPSTIRLVENSKEILKVVDTAIGTATGSSIGAAHRSVGFGTVAPNSTARPGLVAAFAAFSK